MRYRNGDRLIGHGRVDLRTDALAIVEAGLGAADPGVQLAGAIRREGDRLLVHGAAAEAPGARRPQGHEVVDLGGRRLFLVGAGKATLGMAVVLDRLLGPLLDDAAVVVKRGQAAQVALRHIEVLEAGHPLPDESSLVAGRRLAAIARKPQAGDLVIGLMTGGSSTLAVVPASGITLDDKIETNRVLLASGADIVAVNSVRKHLSAIKGGRLGAACSCEIVNFTVSDVVGDPLDNITDPTVPDSSTWAAAQAACDRFGLWRDLPPAVAERLRRADPTQETPKELPRVRSWILADAAGMCTAAEAEARRRGYTVVLLGLDRQGEARDGGRAVARRLARSAPQTCLLAAGEHTVTLSKAPTERSAGRGAAAKDRDEAVGWGEAAGQGDRGAFAGRGRATGPGDRDDASRGGPNQEAALAAAVELASGPPATVVCLDSDGGDGPTRAAGGLVDDMTAEAAAGAGIDLVAALAGHVSYAALEALGDLIVTGQTGTNVNDLIVGLTGPLNPE